MIAFHRLLLCFTLAALAGCAGNGPRFDARQTGALDAPGKDFPETRENKLFSAEGRAFTPIGTTNIVDPQWLKSPTNLFQLGPGDVFDIEILGDANSKSSVFVGPDGKVYYNLLPGMFVWGSTLSETKNLLETEMAKYLRERPSIAIQLKAVASKKVWIMGSVATNGVYSLATPKTLLEAISLAGGALTVPGSSEDMADLRNSFVMRQGQMLKVDFVQLFKKGDLSQNIYLQPDDFVYLRSSVARNIYVFGAVKSPAIIPYGNRMTVLSTIATAGGPLPYAYQSQVAIVRGSLTQPKIAIVDYNSIVKGKATDIRLEPNDIVYIPWAPYRKLAVYGDQILNQFVRTIAINEGRNAVIKGAAPIGTSIGIGQ